MYVACVASVMLHAGETWAMMMATLNSLQRNDSTMMINDLLDLLCQGKGRRWLRFHLKNWHEGLRCGALHHFGMWGIAEAGLLKYASLNWSHIGPNKQGMKCW